MPKKTHGLGRGLDALLPDEPENAGGEREIDIGEIDPNPDQPRRTFTEESIAQLAQSIRDQGLLQPVLVTPTPDGRYRLVAGERRWRAARQAGLTRIPCLVREMDLRRQMEVSLIENLQREDLNPVEIAAGIRALMDQFGYTQEEAAQRLSKSRPAVANLLRILNLPEEVIGMVRAGTLSAGHARVLAGLEKPEAQLAMAREAVREGWNVRRLEEEAARGKKRGPQPPRRSVRPALTVEMKELEEHLREAFGVRCALIGTEKRGRVVLSYSSPEELEALWETVEQLRGRG